jgi:hypothetical protein
MIAKDLDQAYINFDPAQPLPGISPFYVQRKRNPLDKIKRALLRSSSLSQKFLFSGHRGSGKSTELNRLTAYPEIQEKYFIVHYSVRDVLDPAGLEYTDLLLSIGAQIFIEAREKGKLRLKKKLLDELRRWMGALGTEKSEQVDTGVEIGTDLKVLQAKLKTGDTSRINIRKNIEARLPTFVSITNLIIAEVEEKLEKEVLVAIDDLDKPDLEVARKLFYERQTSLTLPACSIIYTIPIALLYSSDATQVKQPFTESHRLPNVTTTNRRDRSPDREGREVMREFVKKRMSLDLIDEEALNYAIYISGGVFREMARVMSMAADNATARGAGKIGKQDVEDAESEIRNEFRRMLETEDYEALVKIHKSWELRGSEICGKLLHNLSILEYRNEENWCDVHPAVVPLIAGE